jgi:hypothetical protein
MGMLVLGVAYCVMHLGPWPVLRDYVNILDKGNWGLFGIYAAVVWVAALAALPLWMFVLAGAGRWLAGPRDTTWRLMTASTGALAPLGLMIWIAFVVPMLMVNITFVAQSLSDPFGWGWDFLGTSSMPWRQLWPRSIPWIQAACVLIGLTYSLRGAWRIWLGFAPNPRAALRGAMPLAAFLLGLSGWLLWFFTS